MLFDAPQQRLDSVLNDAQLISKIINSGETV